MIFIKNLSTKSKNLRLGPLKNFSSGTDESLVKLFCERRSVKLRPSEGKILNKPFNYLNLFESRDAALLSF